MLPQAAATKVPCYSKIVTASIPPSAGTFLLIKKYASLSKIIFIYFLIARERSAFKEGRTLHVS